MTSVTPAHSTRGAIANVTPAHSTRGAIANVYSVNGEVAGNIDLPSQFKEEFRPDLIKRAVLAQQSHNIQPTSTMPGAGNQYSAYLSKRRREYRGTYGAGRSRTPRKVMSRKGTRFDFKGAKAPQTVGGRKAHPSKLEKLRSEKINDKERKKAIRSALTATTIKEIVASRGHRVDQVKELPIVLESKIEDAAKTKDILGILLKLGLAPELTRTRDRKIRAGRGKMRGRKYRTKVGPLFVVSKNCKLLNSARNITGADAVDVKKLNAELLAPGTKPGRLTIWSETALKELGEKKLFM
jgi:large subunit ribosomal protein L4e